MLWIKLRRGFFDSQLSRAYMNDCFLRKRFPNVSQDLMRTNPGAITPSQIDHEYLVAVKFDGAVFARDALVVDANVSLRTPANHRSVTGQLDCLGSAVWVLNFYLWSHKILL
jgi:hypothetical protein